MNILKIVIAEKIRQDSGLKASHMVRLCLRGRKLSKIKPTSHRIDTGRMTQLENQSRWEVDVLGASKMGAGKGFLIFIKTLHFVSKASMSVENLRITNFCDFCLNNVHIYYLCPCCCPDMRTLLLYTLISAVFL